MSAQSADILQRVEAWWLKCCCYYRDVLEELQKLGLGWNDSVSARRAYALLLLCFAYGSVARSRGFQSNGTTDFIMRRTKSTFSPDSCLYFRPILNYQSQS